MKSIRHFICLVLAAAAAVSCLEREELAVRDTQYITFIADLQPGERPVTKSFSSHMTMETQEWEIGASTKVGITTKLNGDATVFAFPYQEAYSEDLQSWDRMSDVKYSFNGDELSSATPVRWGEIPQGSKRMKLFIYSPTDITGAALPGYDYETLTQGTVTGTPQITYILPPDKDDHTDIITATTEVVTQASAPGFNKTIPLIFNHVFTALKFKMGFDCITNPVKSISISGVYNKAVFTFGSGWSGHERYTDKTHNGSYTITFSGNEGKVAKDVDLIQDVMMMIPQSLPDTGADPRITVTFQDGSSISASLRGQTWEAGKLITYTLHQKEATPDYIYFDLNAGPISIKKVGSVFKYEGSVFKNGGTQVHTISKEHKSTNRYYVYQSSRSTKANSGWSGEPDASVFTVPQYERVKVSRNGKTMYWPDFITNNQTVEDVIHAWDNAAGAGKTYQRNGYQDKVSGTTLNNYKYYEPNGEGAAGAVRDVGRDATKNNISIAGNVGEVNMLIDNIYSTFQKPYDPSRNAGGITFLPTKDGSSKLILTMVGDSRLGCIHYTNKNTGTNNSLIFEGTGSLTVADADYYYVPNNFNIKGYYSNRGCSVIGSNDNDDDAYNIIINSGVLYAGATYAEYCTAIGGGGNGESRIIINGGVVTAVASGTGTAIGGGTGVTAEGGAGEVTINNGNVYAYNHANYLQIPTSAIGGAGSRDSKGNTGKITINGGNIYAESGLGTAIGGGSSANKQGASAYVYINDGIVVAKSLVHSSGIGGGNSSTTNNSNNYNGGDATIVIGNGGNPIVRTGSIGGGTGSGTGKIGSAKITILNGDIQAQFVMASSPNNEFVMRGGTIRNSYHTDSDYPHIQTNGGAVYMEQGSFRMTGGIIKNCSGVDGGAVYIKGNSSTTFTMTGGSIERSTAVNNGGAVYLQGGTVILRGGSILNNLADQGNGGGICVVGGNFYMQDTVGKQPPVIRNNAAFSRNAFSCGSGGGIYVASSSLSSGNINVEILSGTITENTSDRTGGGLSVDMAGSSRSANVVVGRVNENLIEDPLITSNRASIFGGGLYVNGSNANIVINNGKILGNRTAGYVANSDVANEGGMVTLVGGEVTHVEVTYLPNGGTIEDKIDKTIKYEQLVQKIVTATNSKMDVRGNLVRARWKHVAWHTRPDGDDTKGKRYPLDATLNLNSSLTLFAIWEEITDGGIN